MPFLERPGARIFYEQSGDIHDPIVTLVNGHTRSSGDFRMMARNLNSAGLGCVILDNRASGKSEVDRSFTLQEMQDDVVAIWDELGLKETGLLGISMGGFICQGIAIRYPERVQRLMLVSTAADPDRINATSGSWSSEGDLVSEKLSYYFAPGFLANNPLFLQTMVKQTKTAIAEGNFAERSNQQRDALANQHWTKDLALIQAETLIVHGAEDLIISSKAAQELKDSIPNARLQILPDVGHLILAEAPKVLYQTAIDFFRK